MNIDDLYRALVGDPTANADKTPCCATSGAVANATAAAVLGGATGEWTYITGFEITGGGATSAALVTATVATLIGNTTLSYSVAAVAGAALPNPNLIVTFDPPLRANAISTAITVSCPALGAGNTKNCVTAHGFTR